MQTLMRAAWLDGCEAALLVYTAGRVALVTAGTQPHLSAGLGCLLVPLVLLQAHPGLSQWSGVSHGVPGAKLSSPITLFHGLLGVPCLLGALTAFCPGACQVAWVAVEASACMLLWTLHRRPSLRSFALLHLPLIKVACGALFMLGGTVPAPGPAARSWLLGVLPSLGGSLAPHLLAALLHRLPSTFTLGEAMIVVHAGLATLTATLVALPPLLPLAPLWPHAGPGAAAPASGMMMDESQAAALFSLMFGGVATAGLAALAAIPCSALPWTGSSGSKCSGTSDASKSSDASSDTGGRKAISTTSTASMTSVSHVKSHQGHRSGLTCTSLPTLCLQALWLLLIIIAGVAAGLGAAWVLLRFLPGAIPLHLMMASENGTIAGQVSSESGMEAVTSASPAALPASLHECTDGLWLAAVAAEGWRGEGYVLVWRLGVLGFWAMVLVAALALQARFAAQPAQPATATAAETVSTTAAGHTHQQDPAGVALPGTLAGAMQPAHPRSVSDTVPLTVVRKGYHLLALVLFVPVLALDPNLLMVSLTIAWALLLLLELCRAQEVPYVGPAVHRFMSGFVDERDAGSAYVTHLALLLGLAMPIWLSTSIAPARSVPMQSQALAGVTDPQTLVDAQHIEFHNSSLDFSLRGYTYCRQSGTIDAGRKCWLPSAGYCMTSGCIDGGADSAGLAGWWLVALSGIVSIGVGDAVASVVGCLWGRHPLHGSTKKTWEGTCAGLLAMLACNAWALGGVTVGQLPRRFIADVVLHTACSAGLEALTLDLDNLIVPLWHTTWMLLCTAAWRP